MSVSTASFRWFTPVGVFRVLQERVCPGKIGLGPTRDRRRTLYAMLGMGEQVQSLRRDGLVALDAVSFHQDIIRENLVRLRRR